MPYIYKIVNKLNNKIYIGKTTTSIEQRWKEHCRDSRKPRTCNRQLYSAFNKYGIENFTIEEIEKCEDSILSERERYWIEYFGSFKNGYNATIGGDGIPYIDYDLVVATYKNVQNQNKTAEILGIDPKTVVRILTIRNESICDKHLVNKQDYGKVVNMYDMNGIYEKTFLTVRDASRYILESANSPITTIHKHITEVCKGKRKSAYKHKWTYA